MLRVGKAQHPQLELRVVERIPQFEFRLFVGPASDVKAFRFLGLRYVRPGVFRGIHQLEGMALLAHLVQLRLRDAFTTELIGCRSEHRRRCSFLLSLTNECDSGLGSTFAD